MTLPLPKVAYLTAGAGGMFCGSCLNDNTLARELTKLGVDFQLIPTYTPIRTDEEDVSINRVFFGGINVFLQQKVPLLRYLPSAFDGVLNHPKLIRWATKQDIQTNPEMLGELTVSMLRGSAGFQRKEVRRLQTWLAKTIKPDLICFTNVLIAGSAPQLRAQLGVPIVVTLQGDDIFLDFLPERFRERAISQIRELATTVDAFVVHSDYYRDYMSDRLGIARERMHVVPLGIETRDFAAGTIAPPRDSDHKRIGYLARLTPEKGLHLLVDAFVKLRRRRDDVELHIAGWLGNEHQSFADTQFAKLNALGADVYHYHGVVDREQKIRFLNDLDVFAVPTTYREPKGLFALEAMACGLPVVVPDHGAFPELVRGCGGVLCPPHDDDQLAEILDELLNDPDRRAQLGAGSRESVLRERNATVMAESVLATYQQVLATYRG